MAFQELGMTVDQIVQILRDNPKEAIEAVYQAKIAGPRVDDFGTNSSWNFSHRTSIYGVARVGLAALPMTNLHRRYGDPTDAEAKKQADQKLIDEGWVLCD